MEIDLTILKIFPNPLACLMQGEIAALIYIRHYLHFSSILSLMKQGLIKNIQKFAVMLLLVYLVS